MDKLAKYIIIAGVTALVLFLGWYFRSILMYIGIAIVVALIGKPVVKFLTSIRIKNRHLPRWLAAALTLALMICICLSLFLLLAPMIGEFVKLVNNVNLSSVSARLETPLKDINEFIIKSIPSIDPNFRIEVYLFDYIRNFINLSTFSNILMSLASFIADLGIAIFSIVFISFFILMDNGIVTETVCSIIPDKYEDKARRAIFSINRLLSRYFAGLSQNIDTGIEYFKNLLLQKFPQYESLKFNKKYYKKVIKQNGTIKSGDNLFTKAKTYIEALKEYPTYDPFENIKVWTEDGFEEMIINRVAKNKLKANNLLETEANNATKQKFFNKK